MKMSEKSDTGTPYTREGDRIYLGELPVSIAEVGVKITDLTDSRGYYLGSDGSCYARVIATPKTEGYKLSSGEEIVAGRVYYLRVEPIAWRVLAERDGTALLLSEYIIANMPYRRTTCDLPLGDGGNVNNYSQSDIRRWLLEDFLGGAFSDREREIIDTREVDNGAASTTAESNPYACENTLDPVFLLSYRDIVDDSLALTQRGIAIATVTDYARATGAFISTDVQKYGSGFWWLRTPMANNGGQTLSMTNSTTVSKVASLVGAENIGVRPAMWIRL